MTIIVAINPLRWKTLLKIALKLLRKGIYLEKNHCGKERYRFSKHRIQRWKTNIKQKVSKIYYPCFQGPFYLYFMRAKAIIILIKEVLGVILVLA